MAMGLRASENRYLLLKSNRRWQVRKLLVTVLCATVLPVSLPGQTAAKIAAINEKVVGKWWTSDKKEYLEFLPDGNCSEGTLWNDGQWHIEHGTLSAWAKGNDFSCTGGVLTLIAPNTLTRDYGMGGTPTKYYRNLKVPKAVPTLTVALAQQILNQQINEPTASNTVCTCHACYDPNDKEDNEKAVIVTTYPPALGQFLAARGYIRTVGQQQVFTAKAKRSRYYEVQQGEYAGFRFSTFRNPKILASKITDPARVPIEYEFVPTELTTAVFGRIQKVSTFASFSYGNEEWRVCIACRQ